VKLTSAVKTLISGATSRFTSFAIILARRYHTKLAAAATITDQAKPKKSIKTLRNFLLNLKGQGPLN
jgi:hypothetical protein